MAEPSTTELEHQVDRLLARCQQLEQQNRQLLKREQSLKRERNQLAQLRDSTQTKVEALINRLKAVDSQG